MSRLTNSLYEVQPYDDWYESDLDFFVEDAATRGINILMERCGRIDAMAPVIVRPAISFTGFWSQGDGLAFDAQIDWPVFIEKNPEFKNQLPEWFLVLVANPDFIFGGVKRVGRNQNMLTTSIDVNTSDPIENGFFAGIELSSIPQLSYEELERVVRSICEAEAHQMYKSLEASYNDECEHQREQRIEAILEEELEQLQKCLAQLLFLGESFTYQQACAVMDFDDNWIDQGDLSALGLIEKGMHITQKGKELLCRTINGKV